MKMRSSLYQELEKAIREYHTPEHAETYETLGHSEMRYRWDLLHASKFPTRELYAEGLNDNHIDTALRRIVGHNASS